MKLALTLLISFCLSLPGITETYTSGSDILFGRSQALSNELAHILINADKGNSFYLDEIKYLREENKYLREQIEWMRGFIDIKNKSD